MVMIVPGAKEKEKQVRHHHLNMDARFTPCRGRGVLLSRTQAPALGVPPTGSGAASAPVARWRVLPQGSWPSRRSKDGGRPGRGKLRARLLPACRACASPLTFPTATFIVTFRAHTSHRAAGLSAHQA